MRSTPLGRIRGQSLLRRAAKARLCLASIALLALTTPLPAQGTGTGSVTGRVLNTGTGSYLNNARITVEGTNLQVFTNEYGEFVLNGVPAGEVKLRVFYTGLEPRIVTVTVPAGETVNRDLPVGVADDETVVLNTFEVNAGRETNIAQIAVNEQRFSPNIKTVIETNAFGDVAEGNVGEFMKFLPGITVDYVAADVRTVSVRGLPAGYTAVSVDGFRMASAASGAATRAFEFEQVSINNAARVEVSKVPTPDTPADALGGSVNLISKNAFEREGRQLNARAYLNLNSEEWNPFSRTPGPGKKDTYKVLPGVDFDLTLPLSKKLGLVVTGLSSNQFNEQHRTQPVWNFAQAGATPTNPYLQQYSFQDGPKNSFRDSFSVKLDYKLAPGHTLWAGYQFNYYKSFFGNRNLNFDVGNNAAPTTTGGIPLTWNQESTNGAAGRGSVRHGSSFRDKLGATNVGLVKYRFNGRLWDFDAGYGNSISKSWYRDESRGHFSEVRTTLQGVSRVNYGDIYDLRPGTLTALNAAGAEIDWKNMSNYRINTVRSVPLDAKDEFQTVHANLRRELDFLPFQAALKVGGEVRMQNRDIRRRDTTWNFVGADGVANTADDNAGPYLDTRYGVYSYWGFDDITWPDPYLLHDLFVSNPSYFAQSADQIRNAERFRIQNSQEMEETITSLYAQVEAKFLNNRLQVTTGVRYEDTEDEGLGAYTPTRGATLADVQQNWRERGLSVSKSYDGLYPSLHVNYNITDNLIARFAYAYTLGRPDFSNILPLVRVNNSENDFDDGLGTIAPRTIIYNNTGLNPWEADNYDLSLEYYFANGGVASAGLFRKDLTDFFGSFVTTATAADLEELNLGTEYLGYTVRTTTNITSAARITGGEFNFRTPLTFMGRYGRYFTFFVNGTKLDLDGPASADFRGFIEEAANVGLTYDRKPLTIRVNVNYRGRQINAPQSGAQYGATALGYREYFAPRQTVDVNAEYRLTRRFTLFANARNLFDQEQMLERYNDQTPDYARKYRVEKFGVQLTMGVKGTF